MPIARSHSVTCRKAQAAAYVSTACVMRGHFRCTAGTQRPATSELSPGELRRFGSACGTHLVAERPGRPHVILRVATPDDAPGLWPSVHTRTSYDELSLTDREDVPSYLGWQRGHPPCPVQQ